MIVAPLILNSVRVFHSPGRPFRHPRSTCEMRFDTPKEEIHNRRVLDHTRMTNLPRNAAEVTEFSSEEDEYEYEYEVRNTECLEEDPRYN